MSSPYYVSPEQILKDKSDYARKGIGRGRSVLIMTYADGILFLGENPNRALHKVSEIYDRIAFAAVGKYNEFENLRLAGVRYADLRGYQYDRSDVTGRGLANAYAQTLGSIFIESQKPYEVELVVAEVGRAAEDDQLYRLTYDGSIAEEHGTVVMGGQSEPIATFVQAEHQPDADLAGAVALAVRALGQAADSAGQGAAAREIAPQGLEAAVLDRGRDRRTFRRLSAGQLARLLADAGPADPDGGAGADIDGPADADLDRPGAAGPDTSPTPGDPA